MSPSTLQKVGSSDGLSLHDSAASRALESAAQARVPAFALMARAGAETARLTLARFPQAGRIWVACGPGNNGGDGLVAATLLQAAGRSVHVSWTGDAVRMPEDARRALDEAQAAGVVVHDAPPPGPSDLIIDALLGLGQTRAPAGGVAEAIRHISGMTAPVLSLDLPTGLCADTGRRWGEPLVRATATLSLLTLKPGLLMADGRDAAGELWFSDLGVAGLDLGADRVATARLAGVSDARRLLPPRSHASHKGRHGDVWIIGGAVGMSGAVRLAGRAALAAGAGRVHVCPLDDAARHDDNAPELMFRARSAWRPDPTWATATAVSGCGGGPSISSTLPALLHHAGRLVLDADALNALAADPILAALTSARGRAGRATVITPHPQEAARLLACDTAQVQADRLGAAQTLADRFQAVVVLKGSGTVVAAPRRLPTINSSGNGRLATAGTGDVLAGWLGGLWAASAEAPTLEGAFAAALAAAWLHGRAAEMDTRAGASALALPASQLIQAMQHAAAGLA